MYEEFDTESNFVVTVMMGIILLALLILIGFILLFPKPIFPYAEFIYPFISISVLCFLGTKGKFESPTIVQYLIIFLISIVPIIGTLYVAYYAGINISKYRLLIYTLISLLLIIIIFFVLREVDPNSIVSFFTPKSVFTSTATQTPSVAASATSILEISPTEAVTETPLTTSIKSDIPTDCILWSDITLNQVGEEVCVYGEYLEIIERGDGTNVMTFNNESGTFNIWSYPKPMWWYLKAIQGNCIMVYGEIITSGVRPIIILGSQDILQACP